MEFIGLALETDFSITLFNTVQQTPGNFFGMFTAGLIIYQFLQLLGPPEDKNIPIQMWPKWAGSFQEKIKNMEEN
jgi:hypothetical protein